MAPILAELAHARRSSVGLFSGIELSVDVASGLTAPAERVRFDDLSPALRDPESSSQADANR